MYHYVSLRITPLWCPTYRIPVHSSYLQNRISDLHLRWIDADSEVVNVDEGGCIVIAYDVDDDSDEGTAWVGSGITDLDPSIVLACLTGIRLYVFLHGDLTIVRVDDEIFLKLHVSRDRISDNIVWLLRRWKYCVNNTCSLTVFTVSGVRFVKCSQFDMGLRYTYT